MSLPPPGFDWSHLRSVGITHLVSLIEVDLIVEVIPVRRLYTRALQDLVGMEQPDQPDVEKKLVWGAAWHVWAALRVGRGVAVHCLDGRGRTGTVLAATLRLRGMTVERAIEAVNEALLRVGGGPWEGANWQVEEIYNPPLEMDGYMAEVHEGGAK